MLSLTTGLPRLSPGSQKASKLETPGTSSYLVQPQRKGRCFGWRPQGLPPSQGRRGPRSQAALRGPAGRQSGEEPGCLGGLAASVSGEAGGGLAPRRRGGRRSSRRPPHPCGQRAHSHGRCYRPLPGNQRPAPALPAPQRPFPVPGQHLRRRDEPGTSPGAHPPHTHTPPGSGQGRTRRPGPALSSPQRPRHTPAPGGGDSPRPGHGGRLSPPRLPSLLPRGGAGDGAGAAAAREEPGGPGRAGPLRRGKGGGTQRWAGKPGVWGRGAWGTGTGGPGSGDGGAGGGWVKDLGRGCWGSGRARVSS